MSSVVFRNIKAHVYLPFCENLFPLHKIHPLIGRHPLPHFERGKLRLNEIQLAFFVPIKAFTVAPATMTVAEVTLEILSASWSFRRFSRTRDELGWEGKTSIRTVNKSVGVKKKRNNRKKANKRFAIILGFQTTEHAALHGPSICVWVLSATVSAYATSL